MSLKHALLGFLSWKPLTGYELKQLFAQSATLDWSGNSNQIYTPLVELHKEGLVSVEVQQQEHRPARKVYTLTEQGQKVLRDWLLSLPEPPIQRNAFLLQLAWADQLKTEEIDTLLASYEEQLQSQALVFRAREQRSETPRRTAREKYLWHMIAENWNAFYEKELLWIRQVRADLKEFKDNTQHNA